MGCKPKFFQKLHIMVAKCIELKVIHASDKMKVLATRVYCNKQLLCSLFTNKRLQQEHQ